MFVRVFVWFSQTGVGFDWLYEPGGEQNILLKRIAWWNQKNNWKKIEFKSLILNISSFAYEIYPNCTVRAKLIHELRSREICNCVCKNGMRWSFSKSNLHSILNQILSSFYLQFMVNTEIPLIQGNNFLCVVLVEFTCLFNTTWKCSNYLREYC